MRITARAVTAYLPMVVCGEALAHESGIARSDELWSAWSFDPWVLVPLVVSASLYAQGTIRLRYRLGRLTAGFGRKEVLLFCTGIVVLVLALLSPLDAYAGQLLSAHMVQHILLVMFAPPLLVLGKPEIAWLWGLPERWRRGLPRSSAMSSAFRALAPTTRPIPAAAIHAAVLWAWHSPPLFDAAVEADWLHWLEHLSFFGTALLFWRAIIRSRTGREAAAPALIASFIMVLQGGLMSALLTLAREPLYGGTSAGQWGMTSLEDQQLAGAIMSIPMCIMYIGAGLAMAARLLAPRREEQRAAPPVSSPGVMKAGP